VLCGTPVSLEFGTAHLWFVAAVKSLLLCLHWLTRRAQPSRAAGQRPPAFSEREGTYIVRSFAGLGTAVFFSLKKIKITHEVAACSWAHQVQSCRPGVQAHPRLCTVVPWPYSLTLPTFQVAEDFVLPAATASFSLRFTAPLLAAEHFRLLAPKCGTACHRKLRRHRLWRPSALDSRRFCLLNHILTFGWSDILCLHTVYSGPSSVLDT